MDQILTDPVMTAEIAADLATHASAVIPSGSTVRIVPGDPDPLSRALGDRMAMLGHQGQDAGKTAGTPIPLSLWTAEIGDEVMVRLSTPTHALSRIYRRDLTAQDRDGAARPLTGIAPQGPLLVESRTGGTAS
ncbi:MAG: hypothetical protein O9256_02340 [Rhizobiaceae bacterium]|jgi:hypothetical protein|nr:hypothetical protein [Rhizobiaceae bacterium]MCZ8351772.1 hypothetical protein [Rhizobium sp.]